MATIRIAPAAISQPAVEQRVRRRDSDVADPDGSDLAPLDHLRLPSGDVDPARSYYGYPVLALYAGIDCVDEFYKERTMKDSRKAGRRWFSSGTCIRIS